MGSTDIETRILCANLERARRMRAQLQAALDQLNDVFPLDPERFDPDQLGPDVALKLDGFRARFADLQDMLAKSMLPALTRFEQEEAPGRPWSTRERLAWAAKQGLIDPDLWSEARELRNAFAHEYPNHHAEKAANYNAAWRLAPELIAVVARIEDRIAPPQGASPCA